MKALDYLKQGKRDHHERDEAKKKKEEMEQQERELKVEELIAGAFKTYYEKKNDFLHGVTECWNHCLGSFIIQIIDNSIRRLNNPSEDLQTVLLNPEQYLEPDSDYTGELFFTHEGIIVLQGASNKESGRKCYTRYLKISEEEFLPECAKELKDSGYLTLDRVDFSIQYSEKPTITLKLAYPCGILELMFDSAKKEEDVKFREKVANGLQVEWATEALMGRKLKEKEDTLSEEYKVMVNEGLEYLQNKITQILEANGYDISYTGSYVKINPSNRTLVICIR